MGMLVNGKWEKTPLVKCDAQGHYIRTKSIFHHWITNNDRDDFQAEPNRYHLYISYACPWASRTLIIRALKGLEHAISVSIVEPHVGDYGWEFGNKGTDTADPLNNAQYLYEIYCKSDANYTGRVTVPILWDKKNQTIVNNESADIMRMLNAAFNDFSEQDYDACPESLKKEIDAINAYIYTNINNGVYKCGFAKTQKSYEEAFDALFSALDHVEAILEKQLYLVGNQATEADWRLFTSLVRFDSVYHGHFKCNLRHIEDYPNLSNYLRSLYQFPKIKDTVNFHHIKTHYYTSHPSINPTRIVPKGPLIDYERPHDRHHK